jgi:NAD(P)H-nitrite reductase large subunit
MEKRIEEIRKKGPATRAGKIAVLNEEIKLCEERILFHKKMYDEVDSDQYWLDRKQWWEKRKDELTRLLNDIK